MNHSNTVHTVIESPLGPVWLTLQGGTLTGLYFKKNKRDLGCMLKDGEQLCAPIVKQLNEYFKGERHYFDLDINPHGTTFQKEVWNVLRAIPYGETLTYSDIADQIDKPNAVRAVGAAVGRNPISIIIPCHRVLGKNGRLTGYAGGVSNKAKLLQIEHAIDQMQQPELMAV